MSDWAKQELENQDISILTLKRTEAPKCAVCETGNGSSSSYLSVIQWLLI